MLAISKDGSYKLNQKYLKTLKWYRPWRVIFGVAHVMVPVLLGCWVFLQGWGFERSVVVIGMMWLAIAYGIHLLRLAVVYRKVGKKAYL